MAGPAAAGSLSDRTPRGSGRCDCGTVSTERLRERPRGGGGGHGLRERARGVDTTRNHTEPPAAQDGLPQPEPGPAEGPEGRAAFLAGRPHGPATGPGPTEGGGQGSGFLSCEPARLPPSRIPSPETGSVQAARPGLVFPDPGGPRGPAGHSPPSLSAWGPHGRA